MTNAPIVAGVSGSPSSRNAVQAAAREAAMHGCPLQLVHYFNWVPTLARPPVAHPRPPREELMRRAVADAARFGAGSSTTVQFLEGPATAGLLRKARTAAMTVIGDGDLRSRVCLAHDALAVQVAARAPGTVMVTRPAQPPAGPVLVCVDGSPGSGQALDFAFDAAACRRSGLIVVHAWEPGTEPGRAAQESALLALVEPLQDRYALRVRIRLVEGDPTTVLRDETRDATLVVVGARGRQRYRGLLGSVAQTLLHHAPSPVVVVRGLLPVPGRA